MTTRPTSDAPTPPRLTPKRWRELRYQATRADDIANRGAGAARKDADSMEGAESGRFSVNGRPNTRSVSAMLAENECGPGAAQTAPDPANPDETGASDDER